MNEEDSYYEEVAKSGFDDGFNDLCDLPIIENYAEWKKLYCPTDDEWKNGEKVSVSVDEESVFEDLATRTAKNAFGVKYLFPWQRLVISNILDAAENCENDEKFAEHFDDDVYCRGRQIVLLPTGAGKSMCFLVPSLILKGATLVFYPLLALMADQKRRMDNAGIDCVLFKGSQTDEERDENFKKIKNGARVILANPEVLQNENLVQRLCECNISHIAIDEAHCVSEWGDSFRSAYLTLGDIIKKLNVKVVTAFTATASPPVLKRVGEVLFDGHFHLLKSESDRANIHYSVKFAYAKEIAALELAKTMRKPMIIFCGTRSRTESMARSLVEVFGYDKAKFYHAGMTKDEKNAIEKWFFDSDDGILAATCAYGMGMDKGNIYSVVHLDAPSHLENFCQEAGRAGRKGDFVHSVLIWNYDDLKQYKKAKIGSRERAMGDFVLTKNCRRQFMLDYLGGEKTVCSGCDLCDAKKIGKKIDYKSKDAEYFVKFVKRHRKIFTYDELSQVIIEKFNKKYLKTFGINVWEDEDVAEIFEQLISEKRLKICGSRFYGKVDVFYPNSFSERFSKYIKTFPFIKKITRHFLRLKRFLRYLFQSVVGLRMFFS